MGRISPDDKPNASICNDAEKPERSGPRISPSRTTYPAGGINGPSTFEEQLVLIDTLDRLGRDDGQLFWGMATATRAQAPLVRFQQVDRRAMSREGQEVKLSDGGVPRRWSWRGAGPWRARGVSSWANRAHSKVAVQGRPIGLAGTVVPWH